MSWHKAFENARMENTADIAIQVLNNGTANGAAWLEMGKYDRGALICHMTTSAAAVCTFGLDQATDNAGTGTKALAGFTDAMVQADTGEAHIIEFKTTDLDIGGGFDYVRPYVTESGVQNANVCAFLIRWRTRYAQASPAL